jgi:FkbM family methyltransferase
MRWLRRVPGAHRVLDDPRLHIRFGMLRGSLAVTDSLRFALNELLLRRRRRWYRLRRSGRRLLVRHPMSDAWVVDEVLNRSGYEPPPEAARRLDGLGRPPRVVDLGGHIGTTSLRLLERFPGAQIETFEPNPENAAMLRETIRANGLDREIALYEAAAGTTEDTAWIEGFSLLSHFVRDGETEAIDTLEFAETGHTREQAARREVRVLDVLPHLERADLAKIDIEGGEWEILADPRFARTGLEALVIEYHPQSAPAEDTLTAVRELLAAAGMVTGDPFGAAGGVGTLWAWRER